MGPFPPREDPHRLGPGPQMVPGRALAQQPGQLGDVRLLDPAPAVAAALIGAGIVCPALADLPARVDGRFPGLLRDQPHKG